MSNPLAKYSAPKSSKLNRSTGEDSMISLLNSSNDQSNIDSTFQSNNDSSFNNTTFNDDDSDSSVEIIDMCDDSVNLSSPESRHYLSDPQSGTKSSSAKSSKFIPPKVKPAPGLHNNNRAGSKRFLVSTESMTSSLAPTATQAKTARPKPVSVQPGWNTTKKMGRDDKDIERARKMRELEVKAKNAKGKPQKKKKAKPSIYDDWDNKSSGSENDSEMDDFVVGSDEESSVDGSNSEEDSMPSETDSEEEDRKRKKQKKMDEKKQKKSGSKLKFKPRDDDSSGEEDIFSGSQNASTSVDLTAMSSEEENHAPPKKKKKKDKPKTGQLKKKSAASHLSHAAPSYREVDSEEERIEAEMQMEEDSDSSSSENPEYNAAANQAASVLSNVTKLSKTIMNKVKVWGGAKAMAAADDDENDDGAIGLTEGGSATDSTWITEDIMRPLLAPTCKLSQYQLVGVNWLAMLSRLKFGKDNVNGILGDEMGLGKTVQTIAFLSWYRAYGHALDEEDTTTPVAPKRTIVESDDSDSDASVKEAPLPATPIAPGVRSSEYLPPHLVIVPASVLQNWMNEFAKFSPGQVVMKYHGTQPERQEIQRKLRQCLPSVPDSRRQPLDVLVTTYSYFENEKPDDRNFLKKLKFSYMVLDEAHCLKNPAGKRYKSLNIFATERRILLTGTPIQNSPKELMALLCFLMKGLFKKKRKQGHDDGNDADDGGAGMLTHFIRDMKHGTEGFKPDRQTTDATAYRDLRKLMAPFILRRKKANVLSQILPPKTTELILCKFDSKTRAVYDGCLAQHAKLVSDLKLNKTNMLAAHKNVFSSLRKASNSSLMLRMRFKDKQSVQLLTDTFFKAGFFGTNASCTPGMVQKQMDGMSDFDIHTACLTLIDEFPVLGKTLGPFTLQEEDLYSGSPKMVKLRQFIPKLIGEGHRILLFSQWTMTMDLLECLLNHLDIRFYRLDGGTAIGERQRMIDDFNGNDVPVFLLSTRAGGMGINLTAADTVIIHDLDFNPTMDEQAQDRCHRIGQKKPVTVYKMVTQDSVDHNIYKIQERKREVNRAITSDLDGNAKEAKKQEDSEISKMVADALHQFLEGPKKEGEEEEEEEAALSSVGSPGKRLLSPLKKICSSQQKEVDCIELLDSEEEEEEEEVVVRKLGKKQSQALDLTGFSSESE